MTTITENQKQTTKVTTLYILENQKTIRKTEK